MRGTRADGSIQIRRGDIVAARYGNLRGRDAVYALLGAPDLEYRVEADSDTGEPATIHESFGGLVLEAARLHDEGATPRVRVAARATVPEAFAPHTGSKTWKIAVPAVLGIAAIVATFLILRTGAGSADRGLDSTPVAGAGLGARAPVDVATLDGPQDARPRLAHSIAPATPRVGLAIAPTIVCRVLVDATGRVVDQRIYRSRLELEAFEIAALEAVAKFRFEPARKDGAPVPVWMNVPVRFDSPGEPDHEIWIRGSDTIGGALAPDLAAAFMARHPDTRVNVEGLGSSTAFSSLFDGTADFGASSRSVRADELERAQNLGIELREYVLGYDGIAVIVHHANDLDALSVSDLAAIYTGEVDNWSQVGGDDRAIVRVSRPSYSGTHSFFVDRVLRAGDRSRSAALADDTEYIESNEDIVDRVSKTPGAVAYVGLGWAGDTTRTLAVASGPDSEAVAPSPTTIRDGTYPIYRPLMLYTRGKPTGKAAEFLAFVLGDEGQARVETNGFSRGDGMGMQLDAESSGDSDTEASRGPSVVRVYFKANSSNLDRQNRAAVVALARAPESRNRRFLVLGHADSEGDREVNEGLARSRADRVARLLTREGIDEDRVRVDQAAGALPVATNTTARGRKANRRVDILVVDLE